MIELLAMRGAIDMLAQAKKYYSVYYNVWDPSMIEADAILSSVIRKIHGQYGRDCGSSDRNA